MTDFLRTTQYFDSMYVVNNPQGRVLRLGDLVLVHPTETSISTKPFLAMIGKGFCNYVPNPCYEIILKFLQPEYKNGGAVLNDYGFNRLEPIKWKWNKEWVKNKNINETNVIGFKIEQNVD